MIRPSTLKLKFAVFLLSLCAVSPALAIGLGDLSVRSFLGQPLHATVEVLGAPATLEVDCMSLRASDGGMAPPEQVRFRIERKGDNALLHITTPRAVNDPIAQFVLVSDCEGRLQREYVVLLDPPAQIEPAVTLTAAQAEEAPAVAAAPPAAPSTRRPRRAAATPHPAASTLPVATATPQPAVPMPRQPKPAEARAKPAEPRLVLSGKRTLPEAGVSPLGLQMDAALPDPSRPRATELSAAELSDENTALNRRLAYLEAQLATLQKRNAELEARGLAASAAAPRPQADAPPHWPFYLLGLGLLTGSGALAAWMRRRSRDHSDRVEAALWTRNEAAGFDIEPPLPLEDSLPEEKAPPPAPQRMAEIPQPVLPQGTEVKEDILDQAEVYVAHGQARLAIHLLQDHLRQAPTESPVPWMLLLDLLHREGDTSSYEAASAECRRHFNINISEHPLSQDLNKGIGLESYPHILDILTHAWNTPEVVAVFHDLIYDNRGGTRMGFEPGAYREILMLRAIALENVLPIAA